MTTEDAKAKEQKKLDKIENTQKMTEAEEKFEKIRKTTGMFLGPILALIIYFLPIEGLKPQAQMLLAIIAFTATWWICEPIPIPATSLLGPTLCIVFGVESAAKVFAPFANPLIYLFLGSFVLAAAMMNHGLDKRVAYSMLSMKWVGSSPARILLALGLVTALMSGWVSNTATTAMMYPIALGLLAAIAEMYKAQGKELDISRYKYATGLMLMAAYASSVGGVLTPVGTPPNIIVMGFLEQLAKVKISFFQWMVWGTVAMAAYFVVMFICLLKMFPADVKNIEGAGDIIRKKRDELGKWSRGEKNAIIAFVVAVTLWVLPGPMAMIWGSHDPLLTTYNKYLNEATVAMVAALLLFLMPVNWGKRVFTINWKEAQKGIDWGTLVLFGGGLSLGAMMFSTGLSSWVGTNVIALTGAKSLVSLTIVFAVMSLLMSELTSHTASTNMCAPLGITAAMSIGVDPVPVAVGIALASSLGFMLPVSTPPNAIVFASGLIPITTMIKSGFLIDLIGMIFITVPVCCYFVPWVLKIFG
jgi:solute carrier family 13 (sodium-dependent dicarboxylate transporter), member 2/3/5